MSARPDPLRSIRCTDDDVDRMVSRRSHDHPRRRRAPRRSRLTGHRSINAVAESFFATARVDIIDHAWYPTRASAEFSIGEYIENFYNPERLHSHLDYVSPIEFELKAKIVETAA